MVDDKTLHESDEKAVFKTMSRKRKKYKLQLVPKNPLKGSTLQCTGNQSMFQYRHVSQTWDDVSHLTRFRTRRLVKILANHLSLYLRASGQLG